MFNAGVQVFYRLVTDWFVALKLGGQVMVDGQRVLVQRIGGVTLDEIPSKLYVTCPEILHLEVFNMTCEGTKTFMDIFLLTKTLLPYRDKRTRNTTYIFVSL